MVESSSLSPDREKIINISTNSSSQLVSVVLSECSEVLGIKNNNTNTHSKGCTLENLSHVIQTLIKTLVTVADDGDDRVTLANAKPNWQIGPTVSYATNCQSLFTIIPDANFEQALIDMGYDTGTPDGRVLTSNIDTVNFLDVPNQNIIDLTGIQDFVALTSLHCYVNQLTSLDVSQNTNLIDLICSHNQLTSLDVSQNTNFIIIKIPNFIWICSYNSIATSNSSFFNRFKNKTIFFN